MKNKAERYYRACKIKGTLCELEMWFDDADPHLDNHSWTVYERRHHETGVYTKYRSYKQAKKAFDVAKGNYE